MNWVNNQLMLHHSMMMLEPISVKRSPTRNQLKKVKPELRAEKQSQNTNNSTSNKVLAKVKEIYGSIPVQGKECKWVHMIIHNLHRWSQT
jgi:hypothetical protein